MISFKIDNGRFNFRVAGLLFDPNNRILIHKLKEDDFYALPGGRVELNEDTESTLIREMMEEINAKIEITNLLWIAEQFFEHKSEQFHELCYYYRINCDDPKLYERGSNFEVVEDGRTYEFKWVERERLCGEVFYPVFIKEKIMDLPKTIEKVVEKDDIMTRELFRK